jgi:phosphoribosylformylglycinamidine synthase I
VSAPKALVLAGPGTNRDPDAAFALRLAGADPTVALVDELIEHPSALRSVELAVIAGGFSYGDALGAGRMLALDITHSSRGGSDGGRLGEALREFVAAGKPLLGVCNGFQVLTRAGLLPGSLGHNGAGHFDCRWVELAKEPNSHCVWTAHAPEVIHCPIAHGEGRYVHPDPAGLAAAGQVALRYSGFNPNGSVADIAGVCDETGLVLGLMPHPENHSVARQHPRHRHDPTTEATLGLGLFTSAVSHVR